MRKFYSLVLMAAALLIGTNAKAVPVAQIGEQTYESLQEAFNAVPDGETATITMVAADYTAPAAIVLGNGEGKAKFITLDLAGNTLKASKTLFQIYSGALKIVSTGNEGKISCTATSGYLIQVFGSILKDVNPRTASESQLYAYLLVDENVKIESQAVAIMVYPAGSYTSSATEHQSANNWNGINNHGAWIYNDDMQGPNNKGKYTYSDPRGVANGVRVEVKGNVYGEKYAIQTNGQLAGPFLNPTQQTFFNENKEYFYGTTDVTVSETDTLYTPFIHIFPTAKMEAGNANGNVAVYASGYARWLIEGECEGASGVYMKSGKVTLDDAIVKSNYAADATNTFGSNKGVNSAGNAVVVESNSHYTGNCALDIEGSTEVSTEANGGTALLEGVKEGENTTVNEIKIGGGSLSGDNAIAISTLTAEEESVVTIVGTAGTEFTGDVTVGTTSDIAQLIPGAVVSYITNSDNTTTAVIATGASQEEYNVSLNGEGLSTFSALDNVRFDASAFKAYKAGEMSNDKLTLSQIAASEGYVYIPAGTGVILYGAASGAAQFERVTTAVPALEGTNNLKPSTAWKAAYAGAAYILHSNELWVYDGEQFADNKAFLILPNDNQGNAPKRIRLVFEETQDVENVEFEAVKAQKFIENGQIFIIRGEKVYNVQGQIVK